MGIPILAGRDFTWNDIYSDSRFTMVSENFARLYWKTPPEAIGKRIRESASSPWRQIVGVVGDVYDDGVDRKPPVAVYWPMLTRKLWGEEQTIYSALGYAVRSTRTGTPAFFGEVRDAASSVSRELPIYNTRTLKSVYDRSMARTSFTLVMLGIAGGMALLLGLVGIYGVISYSVSQRTREIGIRMALGAEEQTVQKLFVRQGLLLAAIGIAAGLVAAAALTRAMSTLLYGVNPVDPVTYVAVAAVLATAAALASWVPARRATSVDPVRALRAE
jgi:predicted permease